jgi:hypothetical protein
MSVKVLDRLKAAAKALFAEAEAAVETQVEAKLASMAPKLEAAAFTALESAVTAQVPAIAPIVNQLISAEAPKIEAALNKEASVTTASG